MYKVDRVLGMIRTSYLPGLSASDWSKKLRSSLEAVSLEPADVLGKYPHQLSGGQLQRLMIARALLLDIKLLVADEIISMLDASTRIDVLNLLGDLKERGLGVLFITHDLSLGNYISDKTVILRRGRRGRDGRHAEGLRQPAPSVHRRRCSRRSRSSTAAGRPVRAAPEAEDGTGPLVEAEPEHFVASVTEADRQAAGRKASSLSLQTTERVP